MPDLELLGIAAYEAYCQTSDGRSLVSGATLPSWNETTPEIRAAWRAAADAVRMMVSRSYGLHA